MRRRQTLEAEAKRGAALLHQVRRNRASFVLTSALRTRASARRQASMVLSRCVRRVGARKQRSKLAGAQREAAVAMQKLWRRKLAQRALGELRRRVRSTIHLQKVWRGHNARKNIGALSRTAALDRYRTPTKANVEKVSACGCAMVVHASILHVA